MKRHLIAAALAGAFALAACGQSTAVKTEEGAPVATDLKSQVEAMPAENRGVFAWQQLTAYQQANPTVTPVCTGAPRRVDAVGIIPADVREDTIYAGHAGSLVFTVQCGPQLTTVGDDPREHWMVVFAPGAATATFENCAQPDGRRSRCMRVPLRTVADTPAPAAP
jgi:hypothetical protein